MENKITPELLEKARQAKSAEELYALAKENGIELTKESANAYFEQLHKTGELADEELDNVSGGCSGGSSPKVCPRCKVGRLQIRNDGDSRRARFYYICPKCRYFKKV